MFFSALGFHMMEVAYGRVKLDGDDWKAEAPHLAEPLAVGDKVRILGHESIILKVEKV